MGIRTRNTSFNSVKITNSLDIDIANNLVTWYPLNGDTNDYAGANNATNYGATPQDNYYIFDGNGDYMLCSTTFYNDESSFTASSWFYTRDITSRSEILDEYPSEGSPNFRSIIGHDQNGKFHTLLGGVDNKLEYSLIANTWYFGVIKFDVNTGIVSLHLYNQTQHLESKTFSSVSPEHNIITSIGKHNNDYFNGYIRDIRIYNDVVSDEFVDAIYNASK